MHSWNHLSFWLILLTSLGGAWGDDQEYRLIRYLMSNYDPAVRPSVSASQPVTVAFRLSLLALLGLDERKGILSSSCRITQKWNDVHLRWNSSDFGGVGTVRIPAAQIWRPDVILRNNADPSTPVSAGEAHAVLKSSGDVSWSTQSLLQSACTLDLQFFPFDAHICHLNFTSWSYDAQQVSLSADPVDLSSLQPNTEFHLEGALASTGGGGRVLAFSLALRRRPGPHLLRQVLPCFLVCALAALCFAVPPSSAERVTLAVGCLLAVLIIALTAGVRNNSAQLPLLGLYLVCCLCLVSSATFLAALTLGLHAKGADGVAPPPWLRKFVLGCMAYALFVQPCPPRKGNLRFQEADEEDRRRGKRRAAPGGGGGGGGGTGGGGGPPIERYSSSPQLLRRRSGGGGGGGERSSDEFERRFLRVLDRVHETLERNEARDLELEGKEAARQEWRKIAQVTDRLLLILFLSGALLSAAMLFAFAPL